MPSSGEQLLNGRFGAVWRPAQCEESTVVWCEVRVHTYSMSLAVDGVRGAGAAWRTKRHAKTLKPLHVFSHVVSSGTGSIKSRVARAQDDSLLPLRFFSRYFVC